LIDGQSRTFEDGMREVVATLTDYAETIRANEDRFLPDVLAESAGDA
jgi:hypothetical protein